MFRLSYKTILIVILCMAVSVICFANIADTSKKMILASVNTSSTKTFIIKEANIKYPKMLEGHQDYFNDYVEKFSVNRRAYLIRTYTRGKSFFPKVHQILKKYNVPSEFAVLLALESAFNGNAVSPAGAVGYWQIMDDVAKEFGLKIITNQHKKIPQTKPGNVIVKTNKNIPVDERKNFTKSTHTAALYLKDRMRNLNNDWLLVAASYNWGVGNVWNALERTGKKNPTFWDIKNKIPAETQAYVMNFIALNVVFSNYENFSRNNLCFKNVESELPDLDASVMFQTVY